MMKWSNNERKVKQSQIQKCKPILQFSNNTQKHKYPVDKCIYVWYTNSIDEAVRWLHLYFIGEDELLKNQFL